MFVRFSMYHKVIQPSAHELSLPSDAVGPCPMSISWFVLCPSQKLFYLFIYFMPVRRLARFVPLCGPFSKSAKLILILIEINEVIFFGHSPASCTTPPPIRFASSLWQMDFNLGCNPGHPWPTKCKTFQNQKCCRTASLYRFIIVCCAPSLAGGGVGFS